MSRLPVNFFGPKPARPSNCRGATLHSSLQVARPVEAVEAGGGAVILVHQLRGTQLLVR